VIAFPFPRLTLWGIDLNIDSALPFNFSRRVQKGLKFESTQEFLFGAATLKEIAGA
jgi:hypothetical protein